MLTLHPTQQSVPLLLALVTLVLVTHLPRAASQSVPNASQIYLPINGTRTIKIPPIPPQSRFILRLNPVYNPAPTPSQLPQPSAAAPGTLPELQRQPQPQPPPGEDPSRFQNTTVVIDLISAIPHRLLVSATTDVPPPCPLTNDSLPPECFPQVTDKIAFVTGSSHTFIKTLPLTPTGLLTLIITNTEQATTPTSLTLSMVRVKQTPAYSVCPGSAASDEWCSGHGQCNDTVSQCKCPADWGGRACHVPIVTLAPPTAQPVWNKTDVPPQSNSTLLTLPPSGLVARIRATGISSRLSVRARVLSGSVVHDGQFVAIATRLASAPSVSMACKTRGTTTTTADAASLPSDTDLPTQYDSDAMATVAAHPAGTDSTLYELVCVSATDIPDNTDWLVAFFMSPPPDNSDGTPAAAANNVTLSVRSMRCGKRSLPPCPLGVGSGSHFGLGAWVGIGAAIIVGVVLLAALVFWTCRKTVRKMHGASHTGSILDGRFFQVVDQGKTTARRMPVSKVYAYGPSNVDDDDDDEEDREDSGGRQTESNGRASGRTSEAAADGRPSWERIWQAEREKRGMNQLQQLEQQRREGQLGKAELEKADERATSGQKEDSRERRNRNEANFSVVMEMP